MEAGKNPGLDHHVRWPLERANKSEFWSRDQGRSQIVKAYAMGGRGLGRTELDWDFGTAEMTEVHCQVSLAAKEA